MSSSGFTFFADPLCPLTQASVILLLFKQTEYSFRPVLSEKDMPELVPFARVPVLLVEGKDFLFEPFVFLEYLDAVTFPKLSFSDPLSRAKEMQWVLYAFELHSCLKKVLCARDEDVLSSGIEEFFEMCISLEQVLMESNSTFRGEEFSLVDCVYAPLFMRVFLLNNLHDHESWENFPKVLFWAKSLLRLHVVQESVAVDFEEKFKQDILEKEGIIV
ncbi:MAG: glutathione S-transferase family protein [Candidatus Woesearchaeota archaeon]|nr:MAG: glutathione S-transferase family protein [Candidatus Woesearchaeota archaeon]